MKAALKVVLVIGIIAGGTLAGIFGYFGTKDYVVKQDLLNIVAFKAVTPAAIAVEVQNPNGGSFELNVTIGDTSYPYFGAETQKWTFGLGFWVSVNITNTDGQPLMVNIFADYVHVYMNILSSMGENIYYTYYTPQFYEWLYVWIANS